MSSLADTAALFADRTRAAFCEALLDGRAWTSGELARQAGVAASTASEQISRLVAGGLLAEERQGRHRYVRLAGPEAAALTEALAAYAPGTSGPRTLRASVRQDAEARARTCYDHLAGRLGVALADAMTARGLVDTGSGIAVTPAGRTWLADTLDYRQPAGAGAPSSVPAWTGPSAAPTSPAPWARRCARRPWNAGGSGASARGAR